VVKRCSATPATSKPPVRVRCDLVWRRHCGVLRLTGLAAAALIAATVSGCGSGDSTVAKTPQATTAGATAAPQAPGPLAPSAAPTSSSAAPDPCAVNLAAPAIARGVSELPRDPRSQQPWNPEPLAGNYNECAQLSAVIVKANTNAQGPNTRAVMFHLGKLIPPQGVPDTYGFNGIDTSQCTGDTIALTYSGGIGLPSVVKFRWNGNGVELIANAGR
jgi:LppP/LprE lipoprotein